MTITDHEIKLIQHGIRLKRWRDKDLADALGVSKSWVSKLLAGQVKSIKDERQWQIEDLLDIRFRQGRDRAKGTSPLAHPLSEAMGQSPALTDLMDAALRLQTECRTSVATAPWIPTAAMSAVGSRIRAIVDENREKPGKITRLVQELLAEQAIRHEPTLKVDEQPKT